MADWKGIGKVGGVKVVEKGLADHEAFVADGGSNIFALDLRVGKAIYGYKGIAGAVNSIAPAQNHLASTSLDQATRIHSTFPPADLGARQEKRGEVLHKIHLNTIPTVVVWDQSSLPVVAPDIDGDDDVWESLHHVGDEGAMQQRLLL
jgi:ribosome biogenesis protein NSA1